VKQSFDIGLRKFRAFISDWNESKSLVLMQQFSQEFIRKSTRTIDSVRHLLQTELGNEQEALEILEKVSSEINENNVIQHVAAKLLIDLETQIEPKLNGMIHIFLTFILILNIQILTVQLNL